MAGELFIGFTSLPLTYRSKDKLTCLPKHGNKGRRRFQKVAVQNKDLNLQGLVETTKKYRKKIYLKKPYTLKYYGKTVVTSTKLFPHDLNMYLNNEVKNIL